MAHEADRTQFRPGDRVLVEALLLSSPARVGERWVAVRKTDVVSVPEDHIHPTPTPASMVREAAEICRRTPRILVDGNRREIFPPGFASRLQKVAAHLEAASATTLREAAAELVDSVERCVRIKALPSDGHTAQTAAKLRSALSREPEPRPVIEADRGRGV